VLDALMGGVRVVTDGGADAFDLARGDRGADPGAAQKDAAVDVTGDHGLAERGSVVGVVDGLGRGGPEVVDLVAQALDDLDDARFEWKPGVIDSDSDLHAVRMAP
jgi:hypothetical protein